MSNGWLCGLSCSLISAFSIQLANAATLVPGQPGATGVYQYTSGPVPCAAGHVCTTTLDPPGVVNLGGADATNTSGLRTALGAEFPGFTFAYGGDLQNAVFNITTYAAFNTGVTGGATIDVHVTSTAGGLPGDLHWVQWLRNDWNRTGYDPSPGAAIGPGDPENVIDGTYPTKTSAGSPFYDFTGGSQFVPPFFEDGPQRGEPTPNVPVINWDAWLFLVSAPNERGNTNAPVTITFYDAIEWGFHTTVTPLPGSWVAMLTGLALVGCMTMRGRRSLASAYT